MITSNRYQHLLAKLLFAGLLLCGVAHADVKLPNGDYYESVDDLKVKVLGGDVTVSRSWFGNQWHPNSNWEDLQFTYDAIDGSVQSIQRGEAVYALASPGVYTLDTLGAVLDSIRATSTGYRWQDRKGNAVDYDSKGKIQSYNDRNNVKVSFQYDTSGKRTGVFDTLGAQVLWYEYTGNLVSAIRDATNRKVQYQYTGTNLTKAIDVLGNAWTYTYDSAGKLLTKTDPEGRKITITYTANNRVASVKDIDNIGPSYVYDYYKDKAQYYVKETSPAGTVTEHLYDAKGLALGDVVNGSPVFSLTLDGRTRNVTDARGLITKNEYDEWNNQTKATYPDGSSVSYQYDPVYSNVTQKIDENGVITKWEYDSHGNLTKLTEAVGKPEQRVTQYTYDSYGNKLTEKRVGDAVTQEAVTTYTYDNYGNIASITDPEGNQRQYNYDVMGNITSLKDARGKVWTQTYDGLGHQLSQADPLNHSTTYAYDKVGNRIKQTDALNNVTQYAYDARNNLIKITDALNGVIQYQYDAEGRLLKETDQEGKTKQYVYNLDGRLTKSIDGNGNTTERVYGETGSGLEQLVVKIIYPTYSQEFKYDSRNRVTQFIEVLDVNTRNTVSTSYDLVGNYIGGTDPKGNATQFFYDALNRPIKITDAASGVTQFVYDSRSNLLSAKDPLGNTTQYAYDRNNRKTKEVRANGETTNYTYDETGNQTRVIDGKSQIVKLSYDGVNRPVGEEYFSSGSTATPDKMVNYSYDAANNLTGYSDGITSATYTFDALKRKVAETVNYAGFSATYSYSYFANGQKKGLIYPDSDAVGYTYDTNTQLTGIQLASGTISYNNYQWVAPTKITLPGGTTKLLSYDPLMRITSIAVKDSSQSVVMNYVYGFDKVDNVLSKKTEHGNYSYGYDALYRLTQATNPSPLANEYFTYDGVGNRLTDSKVAGTWSYNIDNQLTGYGTVSYQYDANGNTIQKTDGGKITNFIYDSSNRLTQVKDGSGSLIAQYNYDPFGRRLSKTVNGVTTYFMYSDEGLLAEFDGTGTLQVAYGFAPNGTWGTNPIFLRNTSGIYFYQNDHLGTPQKLTALDGSVVWSAKAQAFGLMSVDTGSSVTNNLRFPGQYYDQETKTHYNFFRDYDSTIGGYVQSDPIGLEGGSLSTYAYAGGNPINKVDSNGKFGVVGAIGGAAFNFTVQFAVNWYVSGDWRRALRCVDFGDVLVSAAVGAIGPTLLGNVVAGKAGPYGFSRAQNTYTYLTKSVPVGFAWKKGTPPLRLGSECECQGLTLGNAIGKIVQ